MGDPDLDEFEPTVAAPIGAINENYNLNNERLDCERIDEMTTRWFDTNRPSFVTVVMRFFGNIFVDIFNAIFD